MISLTFWYSRDQTDGDVGATHDELDAVLSRVAALSLPEWPALAQVTQTEDTRSGPLLYVGFHVERGALLYSGDDDPDGSYTLGDGAAIGEPLLHMYTMSDCEFPPNAEVPADLIRQAAHEFADTGRRSTCVPWQAAD